MVFQCINIRQVPCEVLKTVAFGLGFQHLPRDLANVNAWKTMCDPYIDTSKKLLNIWQWCRPWLEAGFCGIWYESTLLFWPVYLNTIGMYDTVKDVSNYK